MHERQSVIFGVLLAFLALAFVAAAAVYTGNLNLPWASRSFTSKPTPSVTHNQAVCPPDGALPVAAGSITVNVYNGAGTSGLAKTTGDALTQRGFVVASMSNAISSYSGTARISFGVKGIAQAYTLAGYVDGAEMQVDTRQDASVDITLGTQFLAIKAADKVALDPKKPLAGPPGCVPYSQFIAASPAPTAPVASPTTAAAG
ncbi:MAG TPA: LytR C-terminal domain-containing protein [Cellulomonas sp.]